MNPALVQQAAPGSETRSVTPGGPARAGSHPTSPSAGIGFLIATMLLGLPWLALWIKGLKAQNDVRWARQMFVYSLIVITGLCIVIPFSVN